LVSSVIKQKATNQDWLDRRSGGFAELKKVAQNYAPAKVSKVTGIEAEAIDAAAKAFAEAENGIILFGLEAGNDPSLRAAVEALALITGHAGRANSGVIAILPHANSRGAADMGIVPDRLPGYVPVEGEAGLSAREMLSGAGGLKGMLIAGADPAAESESYKSVLEQLDFLVAQELFLTETAQLADVVLPAKGVAERDGTFTNLERRVQAFDAGAPAPGQAWADWLIFCAIAGHLGGDWSYASADGVMAEITRRVPLYAEMEFKNLTAPISLERETAHYIYEGMSFTADVREGVQWPTLAEGGEAKIQLRFVEPARPPAKEKGLTLVAPRVLYDGGRLLAEAEVVALHIHQPQIWLSRLDAGKLGVTNGDKVTASRNGASVTLPVQVNRHLPEGVAFVPRNVEGRPAERLVGPHGLFATVKVEKS
jgi:predicted molibdopterin-dependent oxidoreductase YjgC